MKGYTTYQEPSISEAVVAADILRVMPLGMEPPPASLTLLMTALAQHDGGTYLHSLRVARRAWQLTMTLGGSDELAGFNFCAGLLHDIGKLNLPRAILNKADRLTPGEWDMIGCHPVEGAEIVSFSPDLQPYAPVIAAHHERPDGRGYPYGLTLAEIPEDALLLAVADAIEAMGSKRPYAPAMSKESIARVLMSGAGTCWDGGMAMAAAQDLLQTASVASALPTADRSMRMPALVPALT